MLRCLRSTKFLKLVGQTSFEIPKEARASGKHYLTYSKWFCPDKVRNLNHLELSSRAHVCVNICLTPAAGSKTFRRFASFPPPGVEKCSRCTFSIAQFRDPPPYDFAPLFILLCLTTIHHHINRKLSSSKRKIYFSQHEAALYQSLDCRWGIWIFIDMFEDDSRNLWRRLSMSHEIL